jgi:hypothetical protein
MSFQWELFLFCKKQKCYKKSTIEYADVKPSVPTTLSVLNKDSDCISKNSTNSLDKAQTSYDDLLNALRLSLKVTIYRR